MLLFFKLLDKLFDLYVKRNNKKINNEWLKYGFLSKYDLHRLDPFEFERWCGELLGKLGYTNIEITPERIDGGKDIICKLNNETVYVECKRYVYDENASYQVTRDIVQKLVGAMVGDNVHHGIIMTSGKITDRAYEYIQTLPVNYKVELWDGNDIIKLYREVRLNEINMQNRRQNVSV